jgi:hypothetical protein
VATQLTSSQEGFSFVSKKVRMYEIFGSQIGGSKEFYTLGYNAM